MISSDKNTINELIEKAIELFSIKGYAATNLTDITDALGISRGPIYYHFKDKLGLYTAAFDKFDSDVRAAHAKIIGNDKHIINFIEDVIFDCAIRNTIYGPNFFVGIDTIEELKDVKYKYDLMNSDIYQEKIHYVERAKSKGEVMKSIDAKQIADLIYVIYNGLLTSIQSNLLQNYTENEMRNLIRILLFGIERYCCA